MLLATYVNTDLNSFSAAAAAKGPSSLLRPLWSPCHALAAVGRISTFKSTKT